MDLRVSPSLIKTIVLTAILVTGASRDLSAQPYGNPYAPEGDDPKIIMDLDTAIQFALERSWRMERVKLDLERDQFNLEASRAALRSNASLDLTLPDFDQSIKEIINPQTGDPKVLSTSVARYSSSLSVRQPLPTDGVVSLNGVLNRTQDDLFTYTPGKKTYYGRVFLRYEQPILQPNKIKNNIKRAELQLEGTQLAYNDEQIRIVTEVSQNFFELYEMSYLDSLAREECTRLEELYRTGQDRFESGEMSEVDLLQLEVDLAACRDRASSAAGRLARQEDEFKQLIGLTLEEELGVEMSLEYTPTQPIVDQYIERALSQRSDLRRNEMWLESNEMELRERRSDGSLTGSVSLTLGLEGREETMSDFYHAIWDPDQARGVAINFKLPIWDWGRNKARVKSKLTEIHKLDRTQEETLKTIRREVTSTVDRVMEAQNRLNLLERSLEAADRSYQLTYQQFQEGTINVQDLLLTQSRLSDARSSYLNAYLDYRRALIDLEAVTTGAGFSRSSGMSRFLRGY